MFSAIRTRIRRSVPARLTFWYLLTLAGALVQSFISIFAGSSGTSKPCKAPGYTTIFTEAGIGYRPRSDSSAYWKDGRYDGVDELTMLYGMPSPIASNCWTLPIILPMSIP